MTCEMYFFLLCKLCFFWFGMHFIACAVAQDAKMTKKGFFQGGESDPSRRASASRARRALTNVQRDRYG